MRNKIIVGLIFVTLGLFLLLANLGIINYSVFYSIFNLWPLVLVVMGINLIFRRNKIVSYITWGLFFIILIVYGVYTQGNSENIQLSTDNIVLERRVEIRFADLDLDIGASRLNIGSTDNDLLSAEIQGRPLDYSQSYSNDNESVDIDFESRSFNMRHFHRMDAVYDFYLNKDTIWDIDLDLGAVNAEIDLEDVAVRSMELESGAANLTLILGSKHDLDLFINSGASNINIILPPDVGLRVALDTALSSNNIEDLNLDFNEDYYISPNYDSSSTRINIDIENGVGKIDFSYR